MYSAIGMLLTAAAVTGFIANSAIDRIDDLSQANIEALANDEFDILRKPNWYVLPHDGNSSNYDCFPNGSDKCVT